MQKRCLSFKNNRIVHHLLYAQTKNLYFAVRSSVAYVLKDPNGCVSNELFLSFRYHWLFELE